MSDTRQKMKHLAARIANTASHSPALVAAALLETLVDVACGSNPALRDFMRMKIYEQVDRRIQLARFGGAEALLSEPERTR